MTNKERLEFIRAGYSANDIREFERVEAFARGDDPVPAAEQEQTTDPEPVEEAAADPGPEQRQEQTAPAWVTALQASIDKLTQATQRANVLFDDMGGEADRVTKVDAALSQYITGKKAGKNK